MGSQDHLEVDSTGFRVVSSVPAGTWLCDGTYRKANNFCVDSLFRLGGVSLPTSPPDKWKLMMKTLGCPEPQPWSFVMPSSQYKPYVKNIIKTIIESFDRLSKDYCRDTWTSGAAVLRSLRPAKIDSATYQSIIESDGLGNGALETFKPGAGGYAQPVVYDRFGTRTGRLTVESGPNILTLKKDHRRVLKSHFAEGKIVSLDFSSLEARVILYDANVNVGAADVYDKMSLDLFAGNISRSAIKVAVLGELYGASRSMLENRLEMGGSDLDRFIQAIRSYFMTDVLKARLRRHLDEAGFVKNRFGRPLFLDDKNANHLLVNTYAQSTGVDVSLLGFKSILDQLGPDGIRPIFVLHDALILDVRSDRLPDVESISAVKVPNYEQDFYVKPEIL